MILLRIYFIWFFVICLVATLLFGILAAILPSNISGVLTAIPYLVAMILVLYKFLKQQRRAPTVPEKKKIALGLSLIFWGYNALGFMVGLVIFARKDPEVWQNFLLYLKQPQFLFTVLAMWLMIAIPLYLITYWFYGAQAQRMAKKMFG